MLYNGCSKENNPTDSGNNGNISFTTPGSMTFNSSQKNYTASGIFDTLMVKGQGAGAFQFKEGNVNVLVVMSYTILSDSNYSMAYVGIIDTLNPVSAAIYPFWIPSGSRSALFGYLPSFDPRKQSPEAYVLMSGEVNVTSMTGSSITGTINGTGINLMDSTKTITLTDGSFDAPIIQYKPFNIQFTPPPTAQNESAGALQKSVRKIFKNIVY
jgi:hypothetical protein